MLIDIHFPQTQGVDISFVKYQAVTYVPSQNKQIVVVAQNLEYSKTYVVLAKPRRVLDHLITAFQTSLSHCIGHL